MKNKLQLLICTAILLVAVGGSALAQLRSVKSSKKITADLYEVVDITIEARGEVENPFEVELMATFISPSGKSQSIPAFYNGAREWVVRFSGNEPGEWSYRTSSPYKALKSQSGKVTVSSTPYLGLKGGVVVSKENPGKFARESGEGFFLMGFEADFLFALDYGSESGTPQLDGVLSEIQRERFNYVVMNVYAYDLEWEKDERFEDLPQYNFGGREEMFPFLGTNSEPDYSGLNIEFFEKLDRTIYKLYERDIISHLMIYVWSDHIAWPELTSDEGNRYFDYVVKRYQAFPNIVWDISKEALGYQRVTADFVTERIDRLREIDSYSRLLTVHDYRYCGAYPDKVDFIVKQDWDYRYYPNMLELGRRHPDKPCVNIENGGYERADYLIYDNGNYDDAETCLGRNYAALFAGAYSTYYWQGMAWHIMIYDWFEAGVSEYRPKTQYYRYMSEFFERYPYESLRPEPKFNSSGYCMTDDRGLYIFYLPRGSRKAETYKLRDVAEGVITYRWFNPLTGEYSEEQRAESFAEFKMPQSPWYMHGDAIFIMQTILKEKN